MRNDPKGHRPDKSLMCPAKPPSADWRCCLSWRSGQGSGVLRSLRLQPKGGVSPRGRGARAGLFRAQPISEARLEIAQGENRSFELDECLNP